VLSCHVAQWSLTHSLTKGVKHILEILIYNQSDEIKLNLLHDIDDEKFSIHRNIHANTLHHSDN
jgi:hypothetical protein